MLRRFAAFAICLVVALPSAALGEFVQIEPVAAEIAERVAPLAEGKSVVVASRSAERNPLSWAVHEAVGVELTAALRTRGIDAVRAAAHPATDHLGNRTAGFTPADARPVNDAGRDLLIGVLLSVAPRPHLQVAVLAADGQDVPEALEFSLPSECLQLAANIPELNRQVVKFCQGRLGARVGDGICATLGGEALKAAGAKRSGVYTWGRELDAQEPILPGDILQLELAKLRGPRFSRNFEHHTAVVEEVRPDALVVLHQNAAPKGKVVQRDTWPNSARRSGIIQGYRPWQGESPLPPVSPRRRDPPTIVRSGNAIDLLQTLDPHLDSVKGLWFRDGGLKWNRDTYARLQVPIEPPERYTLRLKIRRLVGNDQFGIGLIVGGRQVLLSIDGYGGTKTGLHRLDGKKSRENESTYTGRVLPPDTLVQLTVHVDADSVRLLADGNTIVDWSGDPARLSMDETYEMPRNDWLFLTSWNTHCELTEFALEEQ